MNLILIGITGADMKWLDRSLLISPYCYALCRKESEFHKELKKLKIPKADWPEFMVSDHANATVHYFENKKVHEKCCIVCLGPTKGCSKIQVYSILVHEAVHIWQAIRDSIGEKRPASEQEAYAIQSIAQQLFSAYDNK